MVHDWQRTIRVNPSARTPVNKFVPKDKADLETSGTSLSGDSLGYSRGTSRTFLSAPQETPLADRLLPLSEHTSGSFEKKRVDQDHTVDTNTTAIDSSIAVLKHRAMGTEQLFCRIRGICRVGDGHYLLPVWMKEYSSHIARCGLSKVLYTIDSAMSADSRPVMQLKGYPRSTLSISDALRDVDVLGGEPPAAENELLIADLTSRMLLSDVFLRPAAYKEMISASCATQNEKPCACTAIYPQEFHPTLLVDSRVSETKDHLWPKGLIRLLRNGFEGSLQVTDVQDLYGWRFRTKATCFRSLLVTNASLADFRPSTLLPDNLLFTANSLSRVSVIHKDTPVSQSCVVKVLILNRRNSGLIVADDLLRNEISTIGSAMKKQYPNITVQAETAFLEESSFHEQVAVMQEANIVVSSHGSGNANIAFLRPRALFLELLPFGIQPRTFQRLATAYNVNYESVTAWPDDEMFTECIKHFNTDRNEERQRLLREWETASHAFKERAKTSNASIASAFSLPDEMQTGRKPALHNIRTCANYQRISVNAKSVARDVISSVLTQCGVNSLEQRDTASVQI